MNEMKISYEQYCTHAGKNVIMEETISTDGTKSVRCTNGECRSGETGCKNKLLQN